MPIASTFKINKSYLQFDIANYKIDLKDEIKPHYFLKI